MDNVCKRDSCNNAITKKPNVYCCHECSTLDRIGKPKSKVRVLRTCSLESCSRTFSITPSNPKRYCSTSCSLVGNSSRSLTPGGKKFIPLDGGKPYSWRQLCSSVYCQTPARHPGTFCSLNCKMSQDTLDKAFIFVTSGLPPVTTQSSIKNLLLFIRGNYCEMPDCGISTWKGGDVPLVMDHIDGNSEDDRAENLRLVCGNCDMLLPTYKAKNRGNGRYSRRIRYSSSKSY